MQKNIIEEDLEDIFQRNIPWEKLKGTTILITGAYGMLASYVVFMLLYLNECKMIPVKIIALVRSKEKFAQRFGSVENHPCLTVRTDSLDDEIRIDENIDYIIHAASLASPQYYSTVPIEVLKPNVLGNYHLLELAARKKAKGYLLFSTGDIYGVNQNKTQIKETDYGSMDPLDIHSCYSESKRMAETMCKAWLWQKEVPVKILRIWHTYAPTMDIESDPRVFASFVNDIVHKRNIVMKSEGVAKRSFCYIADAVAGYFLVLLQGKNGEAYNICNTKEFYSIRELADILVNLYPELGLKAEKKERDKTEAYVENSVANDVPPDNGKLTALGWEAKYDVKTGFKRVVEYYIEKTKDEGK